MFNLFSLTRYTKVLFCDWRAFPSQMTNDEPTAIARVPQLDDADILTKDDLVPFVEIMDKYMPGSVGVVYEDHDPEVDLWKKPGQN